MFLLEEARNCRRLAASFEGKAESAFLLKVASAFEELAHADAPWNRAANSGTCGEFSTHPIRLF